MSISHDTITTRKVKKLIKPPIILSQYCISVIQIFQKFVLATRYAGKPATVCHATVLLSTVHNLN